MTTNERLGWQISGLLAGMSVSVLLVIACFGLALYFSHGAVDSAGERQVLATR